MGAGEKALTMPNKSSSKGTNVAILVALIGLAGTVITALLSSPLLTRLLESPTPETAVPLGDTKLVFSEDFEDGTASGFGFISDNWTVAKDRSNKVLAADSTSYSSDQFTVATFGPTDFSNGVIEFKLKYEKIGGFYTNFRLSEGAQYILYLNGKEDLMSLAYNSQAQDWTFTLFSDDSFQSFSAQTDVWTTVRIEAQGVQITIYLDGNKLLTGNDARLQRGRLQFSMDYGTKVMLDDIKVWSFDQ